MKTACILCSINCGLEVEVDGRRLTRIRGDKEHPASQGYLCEKPSRLDYYQNARDRLTTPLRRRPDGGFEAIDWDTAIREVAARLVAVRDAWGGDKIFYYGGGGQGNHLGGAYAGATRAAHGGESIFYYGGGGQGNHLGGAYASATRKALGSIYSSNALAQEKTGEFWVDGQLFGRPRCHTTGDFEHAEVAVFVGKNPWHSPPRIRRRATRASPSCSPPASAAPRPPTPSIAIPRGGSAMPTGRCA